MFSRKIVLLKNNVFSFVSYEVYRNVLKKRNKKHNDFFKRYIKKTLLDQIWKSFCRMLYSFVQKQRNEKHNDCLCVTYFLSGVTGEGREQVS